MRCPSPAAVASASLQPAQRTAWTELGDLNSLGGGGTDSDAFHLFPFGESEMRGGRDLQRLADLGTLGTALCVPTNVLIKLKGCFPSEPNTANLP